MSSSRSDVVTQSVRPSVSNQGVFFKHKEARKLQGSYMGVSRKFQGCFKEFSRMFQESFKGVSRKFQGCFKEFLRVFQVF